MSDEYNLDLPELMGVMCALAAGKITNEQAEELASGAVEQVQLAIAKGVALAAIINSENVEVTRGMGASPSR